MGQAEPFAYRLDPRPGRSLCKLRKQDRCYAHVCVSQQPRSAQSRPRLPDRLRKLLCNAIRRSRSPIRRHRCRRQFTLGIMGPLSCRPRHVRKAFAMGKATNPYSGDLASYDADTMQRAQQMLESILQQPHPGYRAPSSRMSSTSSASAPSPSSVQRKSAPLSPAPHLIPTSPSTSRISTGFC